MISCYLFYQNCLLKLTLFQDYAFLFFHLVIVMFSTFCIKAKGGEQTIEEYQKREYTSELVKINRPKGYGLNFELKAYDL